MKDVVRQKVIFFILEFVTNPIYHNFEITSPCFIDRDVRNLLSFRQNCCAKESTIYGGTTLCDARKDLKSCLSRARSPRTSGVWLNFNRQIAKCRWKPPKRFLSEGTWDAKTYNCCMACFGLVMKHTITEIKSKTLKAKSSEDTAASTYICWLRLAWRSPMTR